MRIAIIGFVLGIALLQQQADLLNVLWITFFFGGIVLFVLIAYFVARRQQYLILTLPICLIRGACSVWPSRVALGAACGFCWASLCAHYVLQQYLPAEWEGRDINVIGVIDSLPSRVTQGYRFNFCVEEFRLVDSGLAVHQQTVQQGNSFPKKLSIGWFDHPDNPVEAAHLKPGERWRLTLRLKRANGNANPYGFDYEVWLLEQGIRATAAVRTYAGSGDGGDLTGLKNQRLDAFVWSLNNLLERGRYVLRERIQQNLPDAPYSGVLSALVVGDQREISQADWKVFNRTGIGHLISISGLHITMIAGLFAAMMHFLWRHSFFTRAQLPLLLPARKVAALSGAVAALVYVALAGFGVPAQRTLWMLIVLAMALWSGRLVSASHILCIALGLVCAMDPWAVLWPGFWLSFAAVAVLLYATSGRMRAAQSGEADINASLSKAQVFRQNLSLAVRVQYAVTVGLVPLTLLLFGQISLVSPIANAIAIPLISFIVTPLALLGSILPEPLSFACLSVAHACVSGLAHFLDFLSSRSWAIWHAPVPDWWMFLLAASGMIWLLAPRGFPMRYLGVVCCLPLFVNPAMAPAPDTMQVTVFDIGQGAAVLIETAQHRLLYDTGPGFSPDANSGTRILLPYFQARGIEHLDQLMISHSDNDHAGGARSILDNLQVDLLSSSLRADNPIVYAAKKSQRCEAGQQWEWDGVRFEILHPVPVIYTSDKWKPNALSCTLKVSTANHSLLLAGDIEAIQEDELVNRIPEKLQSHVLLAPHHGSGTSSTIPFLQVVKPELALFQVGYLNRYHHPKTEVMQRYLDFGIKPLRTDISGAITLQFGSVLSVSEYRKAHRRYWYPK